MKLLCGIILIFFLTILSSFLQLDKFSSEYDKLQKLELLALRENKIGKTHFYDLTKKEGCNKSSIKYLGIIKTKSGIKYKVLNSFFVFSAASTCHGSSNIKLYDMKNKYVGRYNVGMPYDLPDKIIESKLICWTNSKDCDSRKGFSIDFEKGLARRYFIPCSKNGGDEIIFSD